MTPRPPGPTGTATAHQASAPLTHLDDALCRQTATPWIWDCDATPIERGRAAAICRACPAIAPCAQARRANARTASGTWAAVFYDFKELKTYAIHDAEIRNLYGTRYDRTPATPEYDQARQLTKGMRP
jgi:hypothetical protein